MVNVARLLAVCVNNDRHREMLGLGIATGDDGPAWLGFGAASWLGACRVCSWSPQTTTPN